MRRIRTTIQALIGATVIAGGLAASPPYVVVPAPLQDLGTVAAGAHLVVKWSLVLLAH
jgi:hypothetical protein